MVRDRELLVHRFPHAFPTLEICWILRISGGKRTAEPPSLGLHDDYMGTFELLRTGLADIGAATSDCSTPWRGDPPNVATERSVAVRVHHSMFPTLFPTNGKPVVSAVF
jgi:hypothetical protein